MWPFGPSCNSDRPEGSPDTCDARHVDPELFDEVGEIVRSLMIDERPDLRVRARHYGIKVWFGAVQPSRCHYEVQLLGPGVVPAAKVLALEVGLHLEEPKVGLNDGVLDRILVAERQWRRALGKEPVAGPFIGRPEDWRRVSEVWLDPDLSDDGTSLAIATRLVDFAVALEPHLCR